METPYSPYGPVAETERFVGRREALQRGWNAIQRGNNLVIIGERALGKTSLALVLVHLAKHHNSAAHLGLPLRGMRPAITAHHACHTGDSLTEVVQGLLLSLQRSSGLPFAVNRTTGVEMALNVKALEGRFKEETSPSSVEPGAHFLVDRMCSTAPHIGVGSTRPAVLVIDETDRLGSDVNIGSFVKCSKEMFTAESRNLVSFVLVGQSSIVQRLHSDHPSTLRTCELVELLPMTRDESIEIVEVGERLGGFQFDPRIRQLVAESSAGYPAVVHRIADMCTRIDDDSHVDRLDFERALQEVSRAIGGVELLDEVEDRIGIEAREIIAALAEVTDFASIDTVRAVVGVEESRLKFLLRRLVTEGIVESKDQQFRIRDRLLSACIRLHIARGRTPAEIRELAELLRKLGWRVKVLGLDQDPDIDLVAERGRFFWKQKLGVYLVGAARHVTARDLHALRPRLLQKTKEHRLRRLWLVGFGRAGTDVDRLIQSTPGFDYVAWEDLKAAPEQTLLRGD